MVNRTGKEEAEEDGCMNKPYFLSAATLHISHLISVSLLPKSPGVRAQRSWETVTTLICNATKANGNRCWWRLYDRTVRKEPLHALSFVLYTWIVFSCRRRFHAWTRLRFNDLDSPPQNHPERPNQSADLNQFENLWMDWRRADHNCSAQNKLRKECENAFIYKTHRDICNTD